MHKIHNLVTLIVLVSALVWKSGTVLSLSPVAGLQELVDGRGDTRVQSREVFYSSKARTLRMQRGPGVHTHPFSVFFKMI